MLLTSEFETQFLATWGYDLWNKKTNRQLWMDHKDAFEELRERYKARIAAGGAMRGAKPGEKAPIQPAELHEFIAPFIRYFELGFYEAAAYLIEIYNKNINFSHAVSFSDASAGFKTLNWLEKKIKFYIACAEKGLIDKQTIYDLLNSFKPQEHFERNRVIKNSLKDRPRDKKCEDIEDLAIYVYQYMEYLHGNYQRSAIALNVFSIFGDEAKNPWRELAPIVLNYAEDKWTPEEEAKEDRKPDQRRRG